MFGVVPSVASSLMWLRRFRNGLGVRSAIMYRLRRAGSPRLDGVRLACSIPANAWDLALGITGGEYDYPGLVPQVGWRVLDVGANIGIFSLLAARRGASVEAYEASASNFGYLEHNVRRHSVNPHHAAIVGMRPDSGTIELWLHDQRPSRHTLLGTEIVTGEKLKQSERVPAVALSELLSGRRFDLVKLDVEGAEFSILEGTDRQLLKCAERWVVEVHGTAGDFAVVSTAFREEGFAVSLHHEVAGEMSEQSPDAILVAL